MARISIEEAKNRLMNSNSISKLNNLNNDEDMSTDDANIKHLKKKKKNNVEFIESINNNLIIFKNNDSYVLSVTDDYLNPVIGEFDEIPTNGYIPPCFKDWLDTYSKEVKYFQDNEDELITEYSIENENDNTKINNSRKTINPLIPYKWGQTAPYNNCCPIDPSTHKRSMTGCTQTALAMVLAYYANIGVNGKKFKRGMNKTDAYISSRTKPSLSLPELPTIPMFDWDNMNFIRSTDFKTPESKKAVAELMKYLGYANKASYSSNGTGATPANAVATAKNKMHFGEGAKIIYASSGVEEFKEQIYKELEEGYPVHFSGWNSEGKAGHAFICDGYDAQTDKFHFNWGWDGKYNGWFDIAILKPSNSNDYSYCKRAIIGLHPEYIYGDVDNDNKISLSDIIALTQSIIDKKIYDYKLDINSDSKIDETDIQELINYIIKHKK